ncbi:acyltransferase family protein [Salsipaludibacter albus]|uniref:acyltransferase family protein n=1 Tax=Salsipaludibacter albus TaxID=2849650 RepID=UPI001EE3F71A|nr:acyltransferase family protein [Salsipaludibacter albus]MBY5160986.1 acyltransferase [Salsipaludibacter albus]
MSIAAPAVPETRVDEPSQLGPSANGWGHRPHLDGLRAVAVYLVLLFHARLPAFAGGFVGVDVFFVLSGYLVTNVILADVAIVGRLRFGRFYARRARRLIPASALAIVGTAVGAVLVAAPLDRLALVGDARAASLWYANWHFIVEAADYFNVGQAESPYLHFWSLAIEEQFYLVFPVLLMGLWVLTGRRLRRVIAAVAVLAAGSVAWQVVVATSDANRAYLGTDTRAYQLLVGVLVALVLWRVKLPDRGRRWARTVLVLALVGLVVVATALLDVSPSVRGLAAAGVSVVLLVAAEWAAGGWASGALSLPTVRKLGMISYGTYLWHWPVVVLTERVLEVGPVALFVISATVGTGLAALSHDLLERPVRRGAWLQGRPTVSIVGGVGIALVVGALVAPAILRVDLRPPVRVPPEEQAAVGEDPGEARSPLLDSIDEPVPDLDLEAVAREVPPIPDCREPDGSDCVVVEGGSGGILLVGDSHARMFVPAWKAIAEQHDLTLWLNHSGSCPWPDGAFLGDPSNPRSRRCVESHDLLYDEQLPSLDPDLVVVASNGLRERDFPLRSSRDDVTADSHDALVEALVRTGAGGLRDAGRPLVLMEPVPILPEDPTVCLSAAIVQSECLMTGIDDFPEEAVYRELATDDPQVWSVDVDPLLCDERLRCPPIIDGVPVRRDQDHLTPDFAAALASAIDDQVQVSALDLLDRDDQDG